MGKFGLFETSAGAGWDAHYPFCARARERGRAITSGVPSEIIGLANATTTTGGERTVMAKGDGSQGAFCAKFDRRSLRRRCLLQVSLSLSSSFSFRNVARMTAERNSNEASACCPQPLFLDGGIKCPLQFITSYMRSRPGERGRRGGEGEHASNARGRTGLSLPYLRTRCARSSRLVWDDERGSSNLTRVRSWLR